MNLFSKLAVKLEKWAETNQKNLVNALALWFIVSTIFSLIIVKYNELQELRNQKSIMLILGK